MAGKDLIFRLRFIHFYNSSIPLRDWHTAAFGVTTKCVLLASVHTSCRFPDRYNIPKEYFWQLASISRQSARFCCCGLLVRFGSIDAARQHGSDGWL